MGQMKYLAPARGLAHADYAENAGQKCHEEEPSRVCERGRRHDAYRVARGFELTRPMVSRGASLNAIRQGAGF
jgi:hypothetical protein